VILINTLSLTPNVRSWLQNSRQTRILHVFDHACNLINERGEILSVVAQKIENGPFNLVIEDGILFSGRLSVQSPISIQANQLHIGDLVIHTADAKLWSPRPDWEDLHRKREIILTQLAKLQIANYQFSNSLASNLSLALTNADIGTVKAIASQLAGLGQGLTPSGDDIILGAILAAWIIHPLDIAVDIAKEITNTAAPLTTSLSAAWLRSAGNGEAGALWHEFFATLLDMNTLHAQASMDKILAVGETSGADALAGFIGTLISYAERETKLCHS